MYNCTLPASDQVTTEFLPRFRRYQTLGRDDDDEDDVHVDDDDDDDEVDHDDDVFEYNFHVHRMVVLSM